MNSKKAKAIAALGLLSLLFYIGIASANVEVCTQTQKCIQGPAGSSICGFVEVCHEG